MRHSSLGPLAVALLLSLLIHFAAFWVSVDTGLTQPTINTPIQVNLLPPPPIVQNTPKTEDALPPVQAQSKTQSPKKRVKPTPAKKAPSPILSAPPESTATQIASQPPSSPPQLQNNGEKIDPIPESTQEQTTTAAPPWAQAQIDAPQTGHWPEKGRVLYEVYYGDQGLFVGRTLHEWMHNQTQYDMKAEAETAGLVSLIKPFEYSQYSKGRIQGGLLIPERFEAQQKGRTREFALFDWDAALASITRRDGKIRTAKLALGDQDVLSVWHQVSLMGRINGRFNLNVIGNKSANATYLETIGSEALNLPVGMLLTEHVKVYAEGSHFMLDFWLARAHNLLPVRVRIANDKGEVLDQWARSIRYDDVVLENSGPWTYPSRAKIEKGNWAGDF